MAYELSLECYWILYKSWLHTNQDCQTEIVGLFMQDYLIG